MAIWIRTQGALALLAVSIGWATAALACGLLADALEWSVLCGLCNRVFLALALGSSVVGLGIIACRRLPRAACRSHWLYCAIGFVCVSLAAWWVLFSVISPYLSFLVIATAVGLLLILDRRSAPESTESNPSAAASTHQ